MFVGGVVKYCNLAPTLTRSHTCVPAQRALSTPALQLGALASVASLLSATAYDEANLETSTARGLGVIEARTLLAVEEKHLDLGPNSSTITICSNPEASLEVAPTSSWSVGATPTPVVVQAAFHSLEDLAGAPSDFSTSGRMPANLRMASGRSKLGCGHLVT